MRFLDLTGQSFGRLTVLGLDGPVKGGQLKWFCQCSCGSSIKSIRGVRLRLGTTKSCGCLRSETTTLRKTSHGLTHLNEYSIWCKIKERCYNKNSHAYHHYGGRGVTVCDRWAKFENFYSDMGPRPSAKHSIDRIDCNKNYEPENCRWATMTTQQRNRTNNAIYTHNGVTACLAELCELNGIKYQLAHQRLSNGASIDIALTLGRVPYRSCKNSQ